MCTHIYVYIHMYIYIDRERDIHMDTSTWAYPHGYVHKDIPHGAMSM